MWEGCFCLKGFFLNKEIVVIFFVDLDIQELNDVFRVF